MSSIIIITLFQEDNIFGMYASLRYGSIGEPVHVTVHGFFPLVQLCDGGLVTSFLPEVARLFRGYHCSTIIVYDRIGILGIIIIIIFILFEPRQANLCLRAFRHDKF